MDKIQESEARLALQEPIQQNPSNPGLPELHIRRKTGLLYNPERQPVRNQTKRKPRMTKSNKHIRFETDDDKSYVYIYDKKKLFGILMWHYKKKKWVYQDMYMYKKFRRTIKR